MIRCEHGPRAADQRVDLRAVAAGKVHRLAAPDEGANLFQGLNPLRLQRHDHPPSDPDADIRALGHVMLPSLKVANELLRDALISLFLPVPSAQMANVW